MKSHFTKINFFTASATRKNISITLARQLTAAFLQFLVVVIIARQLGAEGNGIYAMVILLPTMLTNFLNLGVGPATVYFVSRKEFSVRDAFRGNCRIALVLSFLGLLLAFTVLFFWGVQLFPGVPIQTLYLGLIVFPLALMQSYLSTILQGLEDFKAFNFTVLVAPFINLVGVCLAIFVLKAEVAGTLIAYIVAQAIGLFASLKLVRNRLGDDKGSDSVLHKKALPSYISKTLAYGWKAHLSNILAFINYRADIFLVNFFLTPVATGVYVVAVQITEKLWMLSQAASTVLLPKMSGMYGVPEARIRLAHKSFWVVSGLTALAGLVGMLALFWLLVPVFGEEYKDVFSVFLWLLPGIIAGAGSRIYANCIASAGKPEWNMYSSVLVVTVNVICNIVLIPTYGIIGAAIATTIAYSLGALSKFILIRYIDR